MAKPGVHPTTHSERMTHDRQAAREGLRFMAYPVNGMQQCEPFMVTGNAYLRKVTASLVPLGRREMTDIGGWSFEASVELLRPQRGAGF
jgi:hypothetical protein